MHSTSDASQVLENLPNRGSSNEACDFFCRHIGPSHLDQQKILRELGYAHLQDFIESVVPSDILDSKHFDESLPKGCSEVQALDEIRSIASKNSLQRSLIGLGYHDTATPYPIQRHVLENPGWYTAYTPYQAEISQGRLEALFNFQTLISDLTGLPIANASLLDEATAAAEAMAMSFAIARRPTQGRFLVDKEVLPQTLAVLKTRGNSLGINVEIAEPNSFVLDQQVFGALLQLPGISGRLWDPSDVISAAHEVGALVTVAIDPLAQVLLEPVGALGADIAIGSAQRFGVPMGYGGPHAAFFATRESFKRQVPGRLVGQSVDAEGEQALRLALQTREQHIRRDKATSNICTAQVLLAIIASFYAIYHGPEGLLRIARKVLRFRARFEYSLSRLGYQIEPITRFDCVEVNCDQAPYIHQLASLAGFNLRVLPLGTLAKDSKGFGITFDELSTEEELASLQKIIADAVDRPLPLMDEFCDDDDLLLQGVPLRRSLPLQQPIFNIYRSETELVRYINQLVNRDFSLVHGMIPLGSCTMKLNAVVELIPIGWQEFASLHPFAPLLQAKGYQRLVKDLGDWLAVLTGFSGVSFQPNAGSQGEFAGMLVINEWHKYRGESNRNICLIPTSAHGTNPASCVMAGMKVVSVKCDEDGNIDYNDLRLKVEVNSANLAALMVTYPSTHGVFEPKIRDVCSLVHSHGGQVYLDGANLNAQVGLCRPGFYGADVCHLNLHKTFCIPHGGGGPGVGPIAVAEHLLPFLPSHPFVNCGGEKAIGPVSAAPWGSAGILPISWMYIRMMGYQGLRDASAIAMLSANYIAFRLDEYYPVLFRGTNGLVAHECILDLRDLKRSTGIEVEDIAKRLMDYGFHAPTISWPVAGTLMVEPTECESLDELDRFCEAMISIREEIEAIERGESDLKTSPLRQAPHTLSALTGEDWDRPYSRSRAAFPLPGQRKTKFWPAVARIDNAYGDRNLICSCSAFEDFIEN